MKKKFDNKIFKKTYEEYKEKFEISNSEANQLKHQFEDIKTTLSINKEMLFKLIQQTNPQIENKSDKNIINQLKEENNKLTTKVEELFEERRNIEKKLYKLQQETEEKIKREPELEKLTNEEIKIIKNKIKEKDLHIENLKKEIEKYITSHTNAGDIEVSREKFIVNPTKLNIDLNNELLCTKELMNKITDLLSIEKVNNEKLEYEVYNLSQELEESKKILGEGVIIPSGGINTNNQDNEKIKNEIIIVSAPRSSEGSSSSSSNDSLAYYSGDNKEFLNNLDLDSSDLYFPDKVVMKKYSYDLTSQGKTYSSPNLILDNNKIQSMTPMMPPKLDFNKIKGKYVPVGKDLKIAKPIIVNNNQNKSFNNNYNSEIIKNKKETDPEKILEKQIKKAQSEFKASKKKLEEMSAKKENYKKCHKELKVKLSKIKENIKMADSKLNILKEQIKILKENGEEYVTGSSDESSISDIDY